MRTSRFGPLLEEPQAPLRIHPRMKKIGLGSIIRSLCRPRPTHLRRFSAVVPRLGMEKIIASYRTEQCPVGPNLGRVFSCHLFPLTALGGSVEKLYPWSDVTATETCNFRRRKDCSHCSHSRTSLQGPCRRCALFASGNCTADGSVQNPSLRTRTSY